MFVISSVEYSTGLNGHIHISRCVRRDWEAQGTVALQTVRAVGVSYDTNNKMTQAIERGQGIRYKSNDADTAINPGKSSLKCLVGKEGNPVVLCCAVMRVRGLHSPEGSGTACSTVANRLGATEYK